MIYPASMHFRNNYLLLFISGVLIMLNSCSLYRYYSPLAHDTPFFEHKNQLYASGAYNHRLYTPHRLQAQAAYAFSDYMYASAAAEVMLPDTTPPDATDRLLYGRQYDIGLGYYTVSPSVFDGSLHYTRSTVHNTHDKLYYELIFNKITARSSFIHPFTQHYRMGVSVQVAALFPSTVPEPHPLAPYSNGMVLLFDPSVVCQLQLHSLRLMSEFGFSFDMNTLFSKSTPIINLGIGFLIK